MQSACRALAMSATIAVTLAVAPAPAPAAQEAVVVKNAGVACGVFTAGAPGGPFVEGGCELAAHSDNLVIETPGFVADCVLNIPGLTGGGGDGFVHVETDGTLGVNSIGIESGTPSCTQMSPCLDPAMPWGDEVSVDGALDEFRVTVTMCWDTWLGGFEGAVAGVLTNGARSGATCVTPPRIEFNAAPVGSSGMTWDGVVELAPADGDPCDLTFEESVAGS
jgi:hypothetical protein